MKLLSSYMTVHSLCSVQRNTVFFSVGLVLQCKIQLKLHINRYT